MDEIRMSKKEAKALCEYVCYLERVADMEGWAIGDDSGKGAEEVFLKLLEFAETCQRGFDEYIEKTPLFCKGM